MKNYWWLIFLLIFLMGSGSGAAVFVGIIAVLIVIGLVNNSSKSSSSSSRGRSSTRYRSSASSNRGRTRASRMYSPSQMAKINVYLRRYFGSYDALQVADGIVLKIHGSTYRSLNSLDLYRNGDYLGSLEEFGQRYASSYDAILKELAARSENGYVVQDDGIIDVNVTEHKQEEKKAAPKKEAPASGNKKDSQYFIDELTRLNTNIPDQTISEGLDETVAELRQIHDLEIKFPDSKDKLDKLYDYYLPILVRILNQYESLQGVRTDDSYQETYQKLNRTIRLINDAMKTIISSMTDEDFINLSADISTLEAVLQKDGYAGDGRMDDQKQEKK
jgi:hypothetical protein